jgi:arylsulfatase A-like enzyme
MENNVTGHRRPNILLITTDQQRCDSLFCMGNEYAISPNLDKLAAHGVLFDQAHTTAPVCSPARCSLLTGVHPPIHGCIENGIKRLSHLPVFPDLLKTQGYKNIFIGKTHFDPEPESIDVRDKSAGKRKMRNDGYGDQLRRHGYEQAGGHPNPIPEELFLEAYLVDSTIAEIGKAAEEGRPFFAHCSMTSPHPPVDPPGRWAYLYDNVPVPPLNYEPGEIFQQPGQLKTLLNLDDEACRQLDAQWTNTERLRENEEYRRLYYGLAAYCDAQVGRLIDYLDDSGLRNDTLVIFSSDHGDQLGDHGFSDKHNYYDASWRVPLILSMPGTLPSGERREFAIWNDITATILAAAGASCDTIQGYDLFTPLAAGRPSPRACAVSALYKSAALATRRWKLEYYFAEGTGRLFDRGNDPLERHNLFDHPDYAEVRGEMVAALLTWRCDLTDIYSLRNRAKGGEGHVSAIIPRDVQAMHGLDAERRLDEWAQKIDRQFG